MAHAGIMMWIFVLATVAFFVGYYFEPQIMGEGGYVPIEPPEQSVTRKQTAKVKKTTDVKQVVQREDHHDRKDDSAEEDGDESEDTGDDEGEDVIDLAKARRLIGESDGRGPAREEKYSGRLPANAWHNPKTLKRQLFSQLRSKLNRHGGKDVSALLKDPEARLMLAQWELLHRTNIDRLAAMFRNRKMVESLTPLLNDLRWVTSFVYDGELEEADVALAMVYHFRQHDPKMDMDVLHENSSVEPGIKRRIAAAVAVEFARHHWYGGDHEERQMSKKEAKALQLMGEKNAANYRQIRSAKRAHGKQKEDIYRLALERYFYFAQSWDEGLLNTDFGMLPGWLMRIVCGWKGDSAFGSPSTMRWLRDNTSVAVAQTKSMHSQVPYLPTNKYGDSVHSEWYYQPYDALYPGNFAKEVRDVGGVCVQLSHYAAASACANGVPAMTLSEPGHCSYAVYINGEWVPSNTVSANRFLHVNYWDYESWNDLQMFTAMYQQGQRTRNTQMVCTLATMLADNKSGARARKLYELAVSMQPLYLPLWINYLETAGTQLKRNPNQFLELNELFCSTLAPEHPELCARYLMEHIYPAMLKPLHQPRKKLEAFLSYINHLNVNDKWEWDMETILELQYSELGKNPAVRHEYLESIANCVEKHPEFTPALGWAVSKAFDENQLLSKRMLAIVDKLLGQIPEDDEHAASRRGLHGSVIRAAEYMSAKLLENPRIKWPSKKVCSELIAKHSEEYLQQGAGDTSLPPFTPPEGTLISPGAIVMLSSHRAADQDSFTRHAAALTTQGGLIQSEQNNGSVLTLELTRASHIGGIVIVPTRGCAVYTDWFIETSVDGKKWEILQYLPNGESKPYVTVKVKHNQPNAKFIRINSGKGIFCPGIDFRAVLVYDNKNAK